jgi:hypothetical protein
LPEIEELKKKVEKLEKEEKKSRSKILRKKKSDKDLEEEKPVAIHTPMDCSCHNSCFFNLELDMPNPSESVSLRIWLQNQKASAPKPNPAESHFDVPETPKGESDTSQQSTKSGTQQQSWLIDPEEVMVYKELSRGSTAQVLLGMYRQQPVAIKIIRHASSKNIQDFKQEFLFAQTVKSRFNVYFYGAIIRPSLSLVMEYCERQSLFDVMRIPTLRLLWKHILKFMVDFVKGVSFLHNWVPPLVHRDIKSMNVLVTADWNLKLCDFGLSRSTSIGQMEGTLSKVRGTYTHCAPEVFKGASWSTMSDMYSVAMVLWEMVNRCVTGKHQAPYGEYPTLKFDFQVLMKASAGLRPTLPDNTPEEFRNIIVCGWHEDPAIRYSSINLLALLREIESQFDEKERTWPCANR